MWFTLFLYWIGPDKMRLPFLKIQVICSFFTVSPRRKESRWDSSESALSQYINMIQDLGKLLRWSLRPIRKRLGSELQSFHEDFLHLVCHSFSRFLNILTRSPTENCGRIHNPAGSEKHWGLQQTRELRLCVENGLKLQITRNKTNSVKQS